jgi:excisionase family DNA binding protein
MERLLTPKEAAQYMAVTPRTVKEWLRKGDLIGLKVKSMWRIRASDLEKFIQQGNYGAPSLQDGKGNKPSGPAELPSEVEKRGM